MDNEGFDSHYHQDFDYNQHDEAMHQRKHTHSKIKLVTKRCSVCVSCVRVCVCTCEDGCLDPSLYFDTNTSTPVGVTIISSPTNNTSK
jgi:hypothetical protein